MNTNLSNRRLKISKGTLAILTSLRIFTAGDLRTRTPRDIYNAEVTVADLNVLRSYLASLYGQDQAIAFGWTRAAIREIEEHPPAQRISRSVQP